MLTRSFDLTGDSNDGMVVISIRGSAKIKYIRTFLYFTCPKLNLRKCENVTYFPFFFWPNVASITLLIFSILANRRRKPFEATSKKKKNYIVYLNREIQFQILIHDKLCSLWLIFLSKCVSLRKAISFFRFLTFFAYWSNSVNVLNSFSYVIRTVSNICGWNFWKKVHLRWLKRSWITTEFHI